MKFLRRFKYLLLFVAALAFCSYKVAGQFNANEAKHAEMRENFLRLRSKDRSQESQRLYFQLIQALEKESSKSLLEDQRHSAIVVANTDPSHDDLIWKYCCSVNREIEKRENRALAFNKRHQ